MRPVEFGEELSPRTQLTLYSDDKPDRFFSVIKFWVDETSSIALALRAAVPLTTFKMRKAELIC